MPCFVNNPSHKRLLASSTSDIVSLPLLISSLYLATFASLPAVANHFSVYSPIFSESAFWSDFVVSSANVLFTAEIAAFFSCDCFATHLPICSTCSFSVHRIHRSRLHLATSVTSASFQ